MTEATTRLKSDEELTDALTEVESLWGSAPGTADAAKLDALVDVIVEYEDEHYRIDPPEKEEK